MYNIPNLLTFFRILIIPIIVLTFYFEDVVLARRIAALLFLIACITDYFDGFIARKFNIETPLGKMLDPVADKILVGCILLMLVRFRKAEVIPCLLILSREFLISGLREFLATVKISVPVSRIAKVKTTIQMSALFILLLGSVGSGIESFDYIGKIALWIAAILTIITGYSYMKASFDYTLQK